MFNVVKRFLFFFFSPFFSRRTPSVPGLTFPTSRKTSSSLPSPRSPPCSPSSTRTTATFSAWASRRKASRAKTAATNKTASHLPVALRFISCFVFFFFFNPYLVWSGKCQGLSQVLSVLQKRKASTPRKKRRKRRRRVKRWNEGSVCFCLYAGADSRNKP